MPAKRALDYWRQHLSPTERGRVATLDRRIEEIDYERAALARERMRLIRRACSRRYRKGKHHGRPI